MFSHPLLPNDEERALVGAAQGGSVEARDKVVKHNMRLVKCIVSHFAINPSDFDDYIQEGVIGLIRAIELMDYSRTSRFSTYAWLWVKQRLQRFRPASWGTLDPATSTRALAKKKTLEGRRLSKTQAASLAPAKMRRSVRVSTFDRILDATPPVPESIAEADDLAVLAEAIRDLDDREQRVITRRMTTDVTLADIGRDLGLSRERVRQIEFHAIQQLRKRMHVAS